MSRKNRDSSRAPSEARLAAKPATSQLSTGPRHRTNADELTNIAVLPGECFKKFEATLKRYVAVYRPTDSVELDIVHQMALNLSQLDRYQSIVFANTRELAYSQDLKGTPEERTAQAVTTHITHPQIKEYNRLIAACQRLIADLAKHRNEIEKAPNRTLVPPVITDSIPVPEPQRRGWQDYQSKRDNPDLAPTHNYGINLDFSKQSNPIREFNISQLRKKYPFDPTKKVA